MKIAYVGNFSQPHCTEVHIANTLEDMGHEVLRIQEDPKYAANFIELVKGNDLFLFTRTWSNLVTLKHLEELRKLGIPSASYHLDLYVGLQREAGLKDDPFWRTDFVFSPDGDPASADVFESYGINHFYLRPGVYRDECVMVPPNNDKSLGNDVIFVGGGSAYMHKEWPYRHQLVDWLQKTYGRQYSKYGHPERTVRNLELNQLYSNAKIVVGDSLCLGFTHSYYWSDRVYETTGRGGFIIHPYIEGLEEEFEDGKEIVFYQYGDFDGLKKKIDYYITHDEERESIRVAGYMRTLHNHTYHNRLKEMLDVIEFDAAATIPTSWNDQDESIKINLGAGNDPADGFVNVDLVKLQHIDVVHNLMDFPYPFQDESASEIRAVDVVEHLANYTDDKRPTIVAFMEECYRILKPGGKLYIQTPCWRADFLWVDPTHVRGFDVESFDFFDPDTHYGQTTGFYSKAKFNVKAEELKNHNLRFYMEKR